MRKHIVWAASLLLALQLFAGAQSSGQSGDSEAVFAPFPDRIRVGSKDSDIVISWVDSPDADLGYVLYRQKNLPDLTNYKTAEVITEVGQGLKSYSFASTDNEPYYYFILAKMDETQVYEIFIPLRNVTLLPVQVAPVQATTSTQENGLQDLTATRSNETVQVRFQPVPGERTILYRSSAPVLASTDLLNAVAIAILDSSEISYVDYPIPGVPYYYAGIPESNLKSGLISFVPNESVTAQPVTVPAGLYRSGLPSSNLTSRSIPLPYLVLDRGFSEDSQLISFAWPTRQNVSTQTEKAIVALLQAAGSDTRYSQPELSSIGPAPTSLSGEVYLLYSILSDTFAKADYGKAVSDIGLFLSLPRSPEVAARARHFKGQAYVMQAKWREAFFEFLQSQQYMYRESNVWLDYLLGMMYEL